MGEHVLSFIGRHGAVMLGTVLPVTWFLFGPWAAATAFVGFSIGFLVGDEGAYR